MTAPLRHQFDSSFRHARSCWLHDEAKCCQLLQVALDLNFTQSEKFHFERTSVLLWLH